MAIFLDVGAHRGQTARVALDPRYGFEHVYSFEPDPASWPFLEELEREAAGRLTVYRFGLWNATTSHPFFSPGRMGASIFPDKLPRKEGEAVVELVRASEWVGENVPADAHAVLKLNCEGAECDILLDLLDAGLLVSPRFSALLIDFDARKVPSQQHKVELVKDRLALLEGIRVGTPVNRASGLSREGRVRAWMRKVLDV